MFGIDDLIAPVTKLITDVIDRAIPDKTVAMQAKEKLIEMQLSGELANNAALNDMAKKGQDIILAEANSTSWLTKNWRPLTMMIFVGLITAHWFGWNAKNLTEPEYINIYELVKIGLGGYVFGRSAEKIAPSIVAAIKSK